jgi:hypothetical protein
VKTTDDFGDNPVNIPGFEKRMGIDNNKDISLVSLINLTRRPRFFPADRTPNIFFRSLFGLGTVEFGIAVTPDINRRTKTVPPGR